NDGWKDLYITNGLMRDIRNKDAHKAFANRIETSVALYMRDHPNLTKKVSIWDIVDIEQALALTPSVKLEDYAFRNNGGEGEQGVLTFTKKMDEWGLDQKNFSNGSAYADLDNDGNLDLIINNINDYATIYKNNGNPESHYFRVNPIADDPNVLAMGTKLWLETDEVKQFFEITGVRGMYSTSEPIAHFGIGKSTVIKSLKIKWPDGNEQEWQDLSANQVLSAFHSKSKPVPIKSIEMIPSLMMDCETSGLNYVHKENKFDDYKVQVLLPHKMSTLSPYMSSGDVDGDGLDDVYIGGPAGQPGMLFIQKPDGSFQEKTSEAIIKDRNQEDMGSAFFDADGDGDQDLFVVSGGNEFLPGSKSYQSRLYINEGTPGKGNFIKSENALPRMTFSGSRVKPFDMDGDGDMDLLVTGRHIVWAYPLPASSILLRNDQGKFTDVTSTVAKDLKDIGMVNDATWSDMDGDGKKDIVLTGEWMGIVILLNKGNHFEKKTDSPVLNESIGWWFSIKTADIDEDGDQDIIAGNLGLNYKYKASPDEPFEVYYYDFDENGSKDVVLTYYNFGQKFPLRGRQCSSQQVPQIAEKFPTYDMFASSNVSQIYGLDKLTNALHYAATTFASTYFENKGNGQFESHRLPKECQLSSINDMIIDDLNSDGHLDIITAGNLYNAEVETERADAGIGVTLLGDGKGGFKVLTKAQSGLDLNFDVKSLLKINTAKGNLLLAGCNNDSLKVYSLNVDHRK
ncbi:MAG: FG-GAP-like repeat-containing protein, partial [Saprospiraceae bacterium]